MSSILNDEWFLSILPKTKEKLPRQFDNIFEYVEKLNLNYYVFLETGCIRSLTQFDWQGNFTMLANRFTEIHGGKVYTMNIDPSAIELCRSLINVHATCCDSVEYLTKFEQINDIHFFYLDSMDIDVNNPTPSIIHHHNEFKIIIKRRTSGNFFICIDDNINETSQKGFEINQTLKKLNIPALIYGYQSLYWISNENLLLIKSSYDY